MNDASNTQADPARMSLPQGSRHASMTLVLAMIASASCMQAIATELVPSRNTAAPGESVRVALNPPLNATMPARVHLFLSLPDRVRPSAGIELRIAEWRGDSFIAVIPCNARYDDAYVPLMLTQEATDGRGGRFNLLLASSTSRGHQLRVKNGKGASCAERLQPAPAGAREPSSGTLSHRSMPREASRLATPK